MKNILPILTILATALATTANADESFQTIKQIFEDKTKLKANLIVPSPAPQLNQIETDVGLFYATKDNQYIFSGTLHKLDDDLTNLTELRVAELSKDNLKKIEDSLLIYKAKDEKYRVIVFTDHSCGYCNKLHEELQSYNDLGITIAYAAFPRAGYDSEVGRQMLSAWCANDKLAAFNDLQAGKTIPSASCTNKIDFMHTVGQQFGIRGTPSMILPNGKMKPGYYPANELIELLEKQG